jgi:hypothetical protein
MLSFGMLMDFALAIKLRKEGFVFGSPPLFATIMISLAKRLNILPRLASAAPLACLMVAHLLCPLIFSLPFLKLDYTAFEGAYPCFFLLAVKMICVLYHISN